MTTPKHHPLSQSQRASMIRHKPPLPVDTGWAWLVMLGAFINITIIISFNRATGLFVTAFLDTFREPATVTTMAFGASSFMFSVSNILLPTVLLPRFCTRTLGLAAGVIAGASITAMAFAPSMTVMAVLFGTNGFAQGLLVVPQTALLGCYFRKRLAFANAFAFLGIAVATICSPIVTNYLLEIYGLRGTFLLLGGFSLNIIPVSLLFRPISVYRNVAADEVKMAAEDDAEKQDAYDVPLLTLQPEKYNVSVQKQAGVTGDEQSLTLTQNSSRPRQNNMPSSIFTNTQEETLDKLQISSFHMKKEKCDQTESNYCSPEKIMLDNIGSNDIVNLKRNEQSSKRLASHLSSNGPGCSFKDDTGVCASRIDGLSTSGEPTASSSPENRLAIHRPNTALHQSWKRFLAWWQGSVYFSPIAVVLLSASGLTVHFQGMTTYLPPLGEENGLTTAQVPFLLTAVGVSNLVGKLAIGYVADLRFCNRIYMVCVLNLVLGAVLQVTWYCKTFGLMLSLSVVLGCLAGVADFMLPVLVSDFLGREYIGHMMSGYLVLGGIVMSTDHVIVGAIKDATGFFYISFNYMGILVLLGVVVYMLTPVVLRFTRTRDNVEKGGVNTEVAV